MTDESDDHCVFNVMELEGFMLQFSSPFSWNTNQDIRTYIILHYASEKRTKWKLSLRKSEVAALGFNRLSTASPSDSDHW